MPIETVRCGMFFRGEEVINASDLIQYFGEIIEIDKLQKVMDEIVIQSKLEFNYNDQEDGD